MVTGYRSEPALRTYGWIQRSLLHREPFSEFLPRSDQKMLLMVIFCSLPLFCLSRRRAGYRQHRYRGDFDLRHTARRQVDAIGLN